MTQPGEGTSDQLEKRGCAVAILYAGFMHNACNQKARGVSEKVPFASLDLLARIEPARPPSLGGFNRLAVDHSRGGTCLPAIGLTRHHDKMVVDLLPGAVVAPPVEVALHRRIGWKFLRQQPPLATGLSDKKDRIHQRPHLRHTRPAAAALAGHMGSDHRPLFYGRIACISKPFSTIFRSGDSSATHLVPPS